MIFFIYDITFIIGIIFIITRFILRDSISILINPRNSILTRHNPSILYRVTPLSTEMTSTSKRVPTLPRAREHLWRMALDLPHLMLSEALPLHNSSAGGARLRDKRTVFLLVLPALEGLLRVAREDARVPAVRVHGAAHLRARGARPRVAGVRGARRVVAERGYGARPCAHRDGRRALLPARDVDVLGAAGAAHALGEGALPARPGVARERALVVPAAQQAAAGLGAWRAVARAAPYVALVFPAVAHALASLIAQELVAAFHFLRGPFASALLFLK